MNLYVCTNPCPDHKGAHPAMLSCGPRILVAKESK